MFSLLLMNVSAIALFIFSSNSSANGQDAREHGKSEMIMAGDAENIVVESNVGKKRPGCRQRVVDPLKIDVSPKKITVNGPVTSREEGSLRISDAAPVSLPNEGRTKNTSTNCETNNDPDIGIALKMLAKKSSASAKVFLDGLKGCRERGFRKSLGILFSLKDTRSKGKNTGPPGGNVDQELFKRSSKSPSAPNSALPSSRNVIEKPEVNISRHLHDEPSTSWCGEHLDGCSSDQEILPTELAMEMLTRTQERTAELIDVFNLKVVPAIERMNDKVAQAIRLEKNLDSYASALINAVSSLLCPNAKEGLAPCRKKRGTSVAKKSRLTKAFYSDLLMLRDSRIRDYVGPFSKGEQSAFYKRPVFKTWTTRDGHKLKKVFRESQKASNKKSNHLVGQKRLDKYKEIKVLDKTTDLVNYENTTKIETVKADPSLRVDCSSPSTSGTSEVKSHDDVVDVPFVQRTIGIDDVLALTSQLEDSTELQGQPGTILKHSKSDDSLISEITVTSGMVARTPFVLDAPETVDRMFGNSKNESHGSLVMIGSEPAEELFNQVKHQMSTLGKDLSVVRICDSGVKGSESYGKVSTGDEAWHDGSTPKASAFPVVEQHNVPDDQISFCTTSTIELENVFLQLNKQEQFMAMEKVCLLVLRIFEAWSRSQNPLSPVGLSQISLSTTWSTADGSSISSSRPQTAILRVEEPKSAESNKKSCRDLKSVSLNNDHQKNTSSHSGDVQLSKNTIDSETSESTKVLSTGLVDSIVEAAEVMIAEKALKGLKSNDFRNQPKATDSLQDSVTTAVATQPGFGYMEEMPAAEEEEGTSMRSKSHDSVLKASRDSSAATFFSGQPESSEDAFYECISSHSAATYGSLEVQDSSKAFLEKIQEEENRGHDETNAWPSITAEAPKFGVASNVAAWLEEPCPEFRDVQEPLKSEEYPVSSSSSYSFCATEDSCRISSQDFSADETSVEKKSKKKKWGSKLIRKLLRKKSKPSSFPDISPSSNALSQLQSDPVLKIGARKESGSDKFEPTE